MRPRLSIVSLTLLAIDLSFSSPDSGKDKSILDNPWQSLYTDRQADTEYEHYEKYSNNGLQTSARHDGSEIIDPEELEGQQVERSHRHHPRHERKKHQRDQRAAASTTTYSSLNELTTVDPVTEQDNCTYCAIREANKLYRLEQIRKEILIKLRLEKPPNVTDKRLPQIPEIDLWLQDVIGENVGPEVSDESGDPVVRIISMLNLAQTPPPDKRINNRKDVCYFEFHPDVEPSDIISAKLGVYVRQAKYNTDTVTMFLIYKMKPRRKNKVLIKRKRIRLNSDDTNKWHKFNVDSVVRSWVKNSANNFGLQIVIFDSDGTSLAIVEPENKTEELYKPYIELDLKKKKKGEDREKRMMSRECTEDSSSPSCCRYPMTIDFNGMGWDWVLAPKNIPVYYCSGECDISYLESPYSHLLSSSTDKQYTQACCVPKVYRGIKMMYFGDEDRIEYGVINKIIVDSCSCT